MRIQSILDGKGSRVEAIDSDVRVEEAARRLADLGIGSLVVRDGAVVAGIVDERDIVYGLAKHGRAVFGQCRAGKQQGEMPDPTQPPRLVRAHQHGFADVERNLGIVLPGRGGSAEIDDHANGVVAGGGLFGCAGGLHAGSRVWR